MAPCVVTGREDVCPIHHWLDYYQGDYARQIVSTVTGYFRSSPLSTFDSGDF